MNTYIKTVKNDPKDRLEVEIGDSKQADFYPQLKIKRWDNEVNASFRLLGDTGTQVEDGDKVKYKSAKREAHFYELPVSAENPEGASELEVILLEKPDKNIIEFSMETKELDFLYQSELTQEEKDEGAVRPENVIGSYAVYHKTKGGMNDEAGMDYKTGKAFHIYRPRIEDANGDWVWGELNIKNKKMTVTIPQDFIDNAVYPIRHATGATFGYTTSGGSADNIGADKIAGSVFTGATGTVDSIHFSWGLGFLETQNINVALYRDSDDVLIANGTQKNLAFSDAPHPAFTTWTISGSPAISAVDYVIAGWSDGTLFIRFDSGGTNQTQEDAQTYSTTWSNPATFTNRNNNDFSTNSPRLCDLFGFSFISNNSPDLIISISSFLSRFKIQFIVLPPLAILDVTAYTSLDVTKPSS